MAQNPTRHKSSSESSLGIIIPCAVLVVGLSKQEFRPKDLIFFIDLVKDVLGSSRDGEDIPVQFTQVQRWLTRYVEWGWLGRQRQGRFDTFKIKPLGLRSIAEKLTIHDQHLTIEETLLVQQLIDAYGPMLRQELTSRSRHKTADPWLEAILTPKMVLRQQWHLLNETIAHHKRRQEQSLKLQAYLQKAKAKGLDFDAILQNMPSPFSYTRQHQKPLRDLLGEVPRQLAEFEIDQGIHHRQKYFYAPILAYLYLKRDFYASLLKEDGSTAMARPTEG